MVAIYADGASLEQMEEFAKDRDIAGFTTNPSLMKKAGITEYRAFGREVLSVIRGKPVSFEVLADDFSTMLKEAHQLADWGSNVWVKIPITNTKGESSRALIQDLRDINLNITAVMKYSQVRDVCSLLKPTDILSVFVGRITDTGRKPLKFHADPMAYRVLWASAREIYSVKQAEKYGYDIITLTPELLAKRALAGKNLKQYSLETVQQFHNDGKGITF